MSSDAMIAFGDKALRREREVAAMYWLLHNPGSTQITGLYADDFTWAPARAAFSFLSEIEEDGAEVEDGTVFLDWYIRRRRRMTDGSRELIREFLSEPIADNLWLWRTPWEHMRRHVDEMKRETYRRAVRDEGKRVAIAAVENDMEGADAAQREAARRIAELRERCEAEDAAPDTVDTVLRAPGGATLPTGFGELDDILGGGVPYGDVVTVLGLPSIGKTTFALEFARHLLMRSEDAGVYFASIEMPKRQVIRRHLQAWCAVDARMLDMCLAGEEPWPHGPADQFNPLLRRYMIDDTSNRMAAVWESASRMAPRPRLVMVDYLQKLRERQPNPRDRIEWAMNEAKEIAKRLDAVVLLLSQVRREDGVTMSVMPRVDQGKHSSEIEAGSDFIIGLCRPDYDEDVIQQRKRVRLRVGVLKNRHGLPGRYETTFDLARQAIS